MALALFIISILTTLALTAMIQNHAEHRGLLAIPNHRSSHDEPTPTSGGWAFVLVGLISAIGILYYYQLPFDILWLFLLPLAVVSGIGGFDDIRPLAPTLRLSVQVTCSGLVLTGLFQMNLSPVDSWQMLWISGVIAGIFLVWFINLYNFMDGIDGIAGLAAITTVLSWLVILSFSSQPLSAPEQMVVILFLGSMVGFLFRNWSPAGIFMGDVGSNYIGFLLATVYLYLVARRPDLWIAYLIPCSVFWVDATFTLLRRLTSGQKFLQAHRSHTYQILSRRWQSHSKVVVVMGVYNVIWLLPLAVIASLGPLPGVLSLTVAWVPLIVLACYSKAGLVND